jgi:hypothetical protein
MSARVAVYQLSHKFINKREDVPASAQQVVYYALAVGHHVGVMDCFSTLIEIPYDEYCHWLEKLPVGAGRLKLEGVMKWGEVEINRSHVDLLLPLLESDLDQPNWVPVLVRCMRAMLEEPALYFMMRKFA